MNAEYATLTDEDTFGVVLNIPNHHMAHWCINLDMETINRTPYEKYSIEFLTMVIDDLRRYMDRTGEELGNGHAAIAILQSEINRRMRRRSRRLRP